MTAAGEELPAAAVPLLQDVQARDVSITGNTFLVALPPEQRDRAQLYNLLRRVRADWITGVLDRSVHAAVLDINKELRGEAVAHPSAATMELPDRTRTRLEPGQRISSLYDQVGFSLLILGGAGSGKTISLLELARDLLDRAERDLLDRAAMRPSQGVPVYFNLSTWTERLTLMSWLAREFSRYEVPDKQARAWLQAQRVVLLLDGLDEVAGDSRAACIEAINTYLGETGTAGVAVCSRLNEYTALFPARLALRGAVCLEPLSSDQIQAYVTRAGPRLEALREALESDEQLRTLASTPLMLSVMSLAFHDVSAEQVRWDAGRRIEQRRAHLLETYVERMFVRRGERALPYPREQTLRWLTSLARGMRRHSESVFLIERLQPDWLLASVERRAYALASRIVGGAAIGIVLGLTMNLGLSLYEGMPGAFGQQLLEFFHRSQFGLLLGVVAGLSAGTVDAWRFERGLKGEDMHSQRTPRQVAFDLVGYVLVFGLVGWLLIAQILSWVDPLTGLSIGLLAGLLFGIVFGLHDSRRSARNDIRTVEAVRWSWPDAWSGGRRGAVGGLLCGVAIGFLGLFIGGSAVDTLDWVGRLIFCVLVGLIAGAGGALLGASFAGLKGTTIPVKAVPNQGMALTVRNAVLSGLLVGLTLGAACWIAVGMKDGWGDGMTVGLVAGLFFGMLGGLAGGALDVIQHYVLRLILALRGYAPFNYARYLDHAVALVLLQRAGGGYLFIHRLLLEYFVDRPDAPAHRPEPVLASQESIAHVR